MSETKHTPGPWTIEPEGDGECSIVNREHSGDDWDVCIVHSTEANARLIAAAPALLKACIALQMEASARGFGLRIADEAIAAATGATP